MDAAHTPHGDDNLSYRGVKRRSLVKDAAHTPHGDDNKDSEKELEVLFRMQLIPLTGTITFMYLYEPVRIASWRCSSYPSRGRKTQSPQAVRKGAWSEGFVLYLNIVGSKKAPRILLRDAR